MNRDKKIEELNQDLLRAYGISKLYSEDVAEYLYNAGYRKQRTGHWVSQEEAELMDKFDLAFTCSVCGHCDWDCTESETFNFCPNCGAHMTEGCKWTFIK